MKKLLFVFAVLVLVSCTPESVDNEHQAIEKDEIKDGDI